MKMRFFSNKTYPYSVDYEVGVVDIAKWWFTLYVNILLMCCVQFFILSLKTAREVEDVAEVIVLPTEV